MNDIEEVLRLVCNFLNEQNMRYVIVGGIAVMFHGVPRTTVDIDIILDMSDAELKEFTGFLKREKFNVDYDTMRELIHDGSHSTVFLHEGLIRLDLQGVNSEFDQETLDRAIEVNYSDCNLRIGSVEDTLINKLYFQGEQDLRDALGIYARHKRELDEVYIAEMCNVLGILKSWVSFKEKYDDIE